MPNRALVTGCSGFLGRALVSHLLDAGWQVHALVRHSSKVESMPAQALVWRAETVVELKAVVAKCKPDVCFHLAGHFSSSSSSDDLDALVSANVVFGARLASAIAETGQTLFVTAGSYWQHAEGRKYLPVALYAATKQAAQDIYAYFAESGSLRVVTVKLFETYGPSDPRSKVVNLLFNAARSGTSLEMSPGEQLLDLVHVDDVVNGFRTVAEDCMKNAAKMSEEFALSSGSPIQLRKLVQLVQTITNKPLSINWGARQYRAHEMFEPWEIAPPPPRWRPAIGLEQGLAQMWHEVCKQ